jgi:4,5-dihydroxyphthalate decarboxylase
MVVVRRDVYERHPWVAKSLFDAFQAAKALGWKQLLREATKPETLPWLTAVVEELLEVFGGHPFPDGFEANLRLFEAYTHYSHEQGLSARKLDPAELFPAETQAWAAAGVAPTTA